MKLAVCEAPAVLAPASEQWRGFAERVSASGADVALLNEMPFGKWIAAEPDFDARVLRASHDQHERGIAALHQLDVGVVFSTQALSDGGRSVNQAFAWAADRVVPVHTKQFFPDEPGFYESRWFERGDRRFGVYEVNDVRVGFLICTDVMFTEWARYYGRLGVHLIVVPRATPSESLERWRTVLKATAILSGCYVASSNRSGEDPRGIQFGGGGWVIDPNGSPLAETSVREPVAVADVDARVAEDAKREYPRYVPGLPPDRAADLLGVLAQPRFPASGSGNRPAGPSSPPRFDP